jgi:hypothetical protein
MKTVVFILTAGNEVIFETLASVKNEVPEAEIFIWYHPISTDYDLSFFKKLTAYTPDVVLSTKNQGVPSATGYAMVYKDYDYLLLLNDDHVLKKGAYVKMANVFTQIRRVGFVGEGTNSKDMDYEYEVSNRDNLPDWGGLISKEAVNEVGGSSAFFPAYGFDFLEWQMRLLANNWRVVNYKNLILHGGKDNKSHATAQFMENFKAIQSASLGIYNLAKRIGYKNYNWWSNKI